MAVQMAARGANLALFVCYTHIQEKQNYFLLVRSSDAHYQLNPISAMTPSLITHCFWYAVSKERESVVEAIQVGFLHEVLEIQRLAFRIEGVNFGIKWTDSEEI